jgi:hypothetical protein
LVVTAEEQQEMLESRQGNNSTFVSKTVKAETSSFINKPLDTLTSDNSSSSLMLNLEPQSNAAASLI